MISAFTPAVARDYIAQPDDTVNLTYPQTLSDSDLAVTDTLSFPATGTITSSNIGDGVWYRPELNETSITLMLQDLGDWGIRNLYLDVFRSGETLFPSSVLPQQPAAAGRDWLAYIIDEAHERNIRVHAWAQVLCWHEPDAEAASTHPLLLQHPEWLQVTADGNPVDGKSAARFVSPALPEVRSILLEFTDEVCHYPIDGLNLDALQYNHRADTGYTSRAVSEFRALHEIDPKTLDPDLSDDSDWMKWVAHREDNLTSLVQMMGNSCREAGEAKGKRILFSVAVQPEYEQTRGVNWRYQHWGQWVRQGIVDLTLPQCFNPDIPGLERQLWEVRSVHMGSKVACIPGLLLDAGPATGHPSLTEQHRMLRNTGFQYHTIMDYHSLLHAYSHPDSSEEEATGFGFWDLFRGRNSD